LNLDNKKYKGAHKTAQILPIKDGGSAPERLIKELTRKGAHDLLDIIPIQTRMIVLAEWVHLKCRYGCSQYNTNWCCPPATPSLEEARRIIGEYTQGLLLVGKQHCTDFYRNNRSKREKQVRNWKGAVSLERTLFLKGYYKAFSLVGVPCALCKTCAYPETCLFPQEKRPTVESFSIDMMGTLKNMGLSSQIAHNRKEAFNYYGIILLQ
jgi:predicted metal-binding protein